MDNLFIYNKVRFVPKEAIKPIEAGRLKGKSDINPMWRIKTLTEQFGPCGVGWRYVDKRKWIEEGANGEKAAFVDIDLYVKIDGEWSEPIPGTGGSMFVAKEKNGMYTSDECFKMALTDAISVACKALGFAADVYWESDKTKYDHSTQTKNDSKQDKSVNKATKEQIDHIAALAKEKGMEGPAFWDYLKRMENEGKISSQYAYNKDKSIRWTVEDIKALEADLELPF